MYVLIVRNTSNESAIDASLLLQTYLSFQSIDWGVIECNDLVDVPHLDRYAFLTEEPDLAVVLGGDGTLLNTAHLLRGLTVPILGLNFGHLGFLTHSDTGGVVKTVAAALAGEVVVEKRANLSIHVLFEGEDVSQMLHDTLEEDRTFFALNELAITRGSLGRIIDFSFGIAGSPVAKMRGDGLVVATATGSTAYSLSAGGPLVTPEFQGLVVVPLAPHTLQSRAVVTAKSDVVEIDLTTDISRCEGTLFADGRKLTFDRPISKVLVQVGDVPTTLLRYGESSFYQHVSEVFFVGSPHPNE